MSGLGAARRSDVEQLRHRVEAKARRMYEEECVFGRLPWAEAGVEVRAEYLGQAIVALAGCVR